MNIWVADYGVRGRAGKVGEFGTFMAAYRLVAPKIHGLKAKAGLIRYWRAHEAGMVAEIYMVGGRV